MLLPDGRWNLPTPGCVLPGMPATAPGPAAPKPSAFSPSRPEFWILLASLIFIGVLLESGYFEREVLVLHLFQSLIYVAVITFALRGSKWGYGIGLSIAAIWNLYNTFSGFVFDAGFREWSRFLSSGRISNPVTFVAPIAWFDHLLLAIAILWAYLAQVKKRLSDLLVLAASFLVTALYFFGIIALLWPQFIRQMQRQFGF